MRYWWVNQNQTFAHERAGGYLWSPKRAAGGRRNHFYSTMREVQPGDLVLSFRSTRIVAVGVAKSWCYESPKPVEFGSAGLNWEAVGWRVDVYWTDLQHQVRPAEHIGALRHTLPERYAPLQRDTGHGLQGVYLAEVPAPMMQALAGIIGYELRLLMDAPPAPMPERVADRPEAADTLKRTWEDHLEKRIITDPYLASTERSALVNARRGQGRFRENVLAIEKACRVTRVDNPEHLVASHCKPWRHADNGERLDGENGLMLTPSIDHLFDRGFITFEDGGRLVVSPVADRTSLLRMGVDPGARIVVGAFSSGQRGYLDYHRNEIFLSAG